MSERRAFKSERLVSGKDTEDAWNWQGTARSSRRLEQLSQGKSSRRGDQRHKGRPDGL